MMDCKKNDIENFMSYLFMQYSFLFLFPKSVKNVRHLIFCVSRCFIQLNMYFCDDLYSSFRNTNINTCKHRPFVVRA